uniref:Uncharacterized protein n=1 Tax=Panagrolaimus sp. ES5 TaxID=591445 RepID=A0AC34GGB1_9BILA
MFRFIYQRVSPQFRAFTILARQNFTQKNARRNFAFLSTGGSTTLALSLFGSSSTKEKNVKAGKENSPELLMREADAFYDNYMIDNCWGVLRRFERTTNPEILWRIARVLAEKAKITLNKEEKRTLFLEALEYAEKAIKNEEAPGCFGAHKWFAIINNYVGEIEGTK